MPQAPQTPGAKVESQTDLPCVQADEAAFETPCKETHSEADTGTAVRATAARYSLVGRLHE